MIELHPRQPIEDIGQRASAALHTTAQALQELMAEGQAAYQILLSERWAVQERCRALQAAAEFNQLARQELAEWQVRSEELDQQIQSWQGMKRKLEALIQHHQAAAELLNTSSDEEPDEWADALPRLHLIRSQEEERRHIAEQLRAGPGQLLANAALELEYAVPLVESQPAEVCAGLAELKNELRTGLIQLRQLIAELEPPPLLEELGLAASLTRYLESYQAQTGLQVHLDIDLPADLPDTMAITIFRILQEALTNIRKHANATRVCISGQTQDEVLVLTVEDDGCGFDNALLGHTPRRHPGLIRMHDRAALLHGRLQITSQAGRGTQIKLTIPYSAHPHRP